MDYDALLDAYKDAWESSKKQAKNALNATLQALQQNYDTGAAEVNARYDQAISRQNAESDKSLNDAFISSKLGSRNLNQQLAALGKSGGAAESTLLSLANAYRGDRADIERQRESANAESELGRSGELADLLKALNTGRAEANDTYQQRLSDAAGKYETALQSAYSDYAKNTLSQGAAQASGTGSTAGTRGTGGTGTAKTYSSTSRSLAQSLSGLSARGWTENQLKSYMQRLGYSAADITGALQLLKQQ